VVCGDRGLLRAYLDRELSARQEAEVDRHVASCAQCRESLAEMEQTAGLTRSRLALLRGEDSPPPALSVEELEARARERRSVSGRLRPLASAAGRAPRPAPGAGAAPVVLALSATLWLAPKAITADSLVNVFRVQSFTAVQVDVTELQNLKMPQPDSPLGTYTGPTQPNVLPVTADEATKRIGFGLRSVSSGKLPSIMDQQPIILVTDPAQFSYAYDYAKVQDYWRKSGLQGDAPKELDGLVVKGSVPAAAAVVYVETGAKAQVEQMMAQAAAAQEAAKSGQKPSLDSGTAPKESASGLASQKMLAVVQLRSPELQVPAGVDVNKIHNQLLLAAPLPADIVKQLQGIADWKGTVPVPVASGASSKSSEVAIDGVTGLLVTDTEHGGSILMWQKDGVIYAVFGTVSETEVLDAARSLT
jgi:anti-sigma factor RsiW